MKLYIELQGQMYQLTEAAATEMLGNEADLLFRDILAYREQQCDGMVEVTRDKLIRVATEVIDEVMRKNVDYQDSWQRQGIHGTLCRIADKLFRIETLADGREALVVEEKIEKTGIDNIGYTFLLLLYLKEKKFDGLPISFWGLGDGPESS